MKEIENTTTTFESIKHLDENGQEFWFARELMVALEYKRWEKFYNVINNSKMACEKSNNLIAEHFLQVKKMIEIAKGAKRKIEDYKLSRYACYLIVQNSDPRKETVALGQTYFAVQIRKQEKGNYSLNQTAKNAGVKNFDKFYNAGYKGLYNGETADDIAKRKGLRYREDILDNMGSVELAAHLLE